MSERRWQYKVETVKTSIWNNKPEKVDGVIQDRLTRLGVEGWELVSVVPYGHLNRLYLKR
jgi:hypothetical protein